MPGLMKSTTWLIYFRSQLIHRSFTSLSLITFSIETSLSRLCSRPLVYLMSTPWYVARLYAEPVMCHTLCTPTVLCCTLSTTVLLQLLSTQEPPSTSTVRWLSGCPIHTSSRRHFVPHSPGYHLNVIHFLPSTHRDVLLTSAFSTDWS